MFHKPHKTDFVSNVTVSEKRFSLDDYAGTVEAIARVTELAVFL